MGALPAALLPEGVTSADPYLIPLESWEGLQPPDPEALDWLSSRIRRLDRGRVREMSPELMERLVANAAAGERSGMDFFADPGLLRDRLYNPPSPCSCRSGGDTTSTPCSSSKAGRSRVGE
jgi:hypothetical protein